MDGVPISPRTPSFGKQKGKSYGKGKGKAHGFPSQSFNKGKGMAKTGKGFQGQSKGNKGKTVDTFIIYNGSTALDTSHTATGQNPVPKASAVPLPQNSYNGEVQPKEKASKQTMRLIQHMEAKFQAKVAKALAKPVKGAGLKEGATKKSAPPDAAAGQEQEDRQAKVAKTLAKPVKGAGLKEGATKKSAPPDAAAGQEQEDRQAMQVDEDANRSSLNQKLKDKLDQPLAALIEEDAKSSSSKNGKPRPYPAPQVSRDIKADASKGGTKPRIKPAVPGELTVPQFHALNDVVDQMDAALASDTEKRILQSDLMVYSQALMSIANMAVQ